MGGPGATILVADDERIIRDLCVLILGELGYKAMSAFDGADALHQYKTANPPIDLVILDMVMPNMDGPATFHALRAFDPAACILLSTGFIGEDVQILLAAGAAGVVQKPFRVSELSNAITAALA